MKKLTFLLVIITSSLFSQVNGYKFGGSGNDAVEAITTDSVGNYFVLGHFQNTITFDSAGSGKTFTSSSTNTSYVVKYNCLNVFQWCLRISGTNLNSYSGGSIKYKNNALYLVTTFQSSTTITSSNNSTTTKSGSGTYSGLLLKVNVNGVLIWANDIESAAGKAELSDVEISPSGSIYITGEYNGNTATAYGQNSTSVTTGSNLGNADAFMFKFNSLGEAVWKLTGGGTGDDVGAYLKFDNLGNLFASGQYSCCGSGSATFGSFTLSNSSGWGTWISRIDTTGSFIWVIGQAADFGCAGGLQTDENNYLYFTGNFTGTKTVISFSGTGYSKSLTSNGGTEIVVSKYNPSGELIWAKSFGSTGTDFGSRSFYKNNKLYVHAMVSGNVTITQGSNTFTFTNGGNTDDILVIYDSSGVCLGGTKISGAGSERSLIVYYSFSGKLYIGGLFDGTITSNSVSLTSNGSQDGYLYVFDSTATSTTLIDNRINTICSGDSVKFRVGLNVGSFLWSPGTTLSDSTIASPFAKPTANTTYLLKYTNPQGCIYYDTAKVSIVNVTANAGSDVSICGGDSTQLTASGGISYSWSPSAGLSNPNIFNPFAKPSVTTNYVVTVSNGGCSRTDTVKITVNPKPSIATNNDTTLCQGTSKLLITTGTATRYLWNTGDTTSTITVTPGATTTYWVRGQIGTSTCYTYDSVNINVLNCTTSCLNCTTAPNNLNDSLKLCMPFNNNTVDESGNGFNGTPTNITMTTDRFGQTNKAASFNGSSSQVTINNNANLNYNASSQFSICLWFNATASTTFTTFITKCEQSDTSGYVIGFDNTGRVRFLTNLLYPVNTVNPVSTGVWNFYCVTFNTKNDIKIYLNGVLNNTGTVPNLNQSSYPVILGRLCNSLCSYFYNGKLDDLRIYKRVLSAQEVAALYNANTKATLTSNADTALCVGNTKTLTTSGTANRFLWSTGDTTSSITVTVTKDTTIWVRGQIGNSVCYTYDSVNIIAIPMPVVKSNNDTTLCSGTSKTLTTTGTATRFLWNTGDTTASINISPASSSTYWVRGQIGNASCYSYDTIYINVINCNPSCINCSDASLSINNSLVACYPLDTFISGTAQDFSAGQNHLTITGALTQSANRQLQPRKTLRFTNASDRARVASIPQLINPTSVSFTGWFNINHNNNFGRPYALVSLSNNRLDPPFVGAVNTDINFWVYLFQNATLDTITVEFDNWNKGLYGFAIQKKQVQRNTWYFYTAVVDTQSKKAKFFFGAQNGALDSIVVPINMSNYAYPTQNVITQKLSVGNHINDVWAMNGLVDDYRVYNKALSYSQIVELFYDWEKPELISNNDTTVCRGTSLNLTTKGNANRFLWNTGDTTSSITVTLTKDSVIWVRGQIGTSSCYNYDTIRITAPPFPVINTLNDTTICSGSTISLTTSGTANRYLWSTGDTTASISVSPGALTSYWVRGQIGSAKCYAYDTVKVSIKNCNTVCYTCSASNSINTGLVACYPFNGNVNDETGNGHNGTNFGASLTTDRFGNPNAAYSFNGSSNYISIPYSAAFNFAPTGSFSLSAWVNPATGITSFGGVIIKSPSPSPGLWDYGLYHTNAYKAMTGYANNNLLTTNTSVPANKWYFLTVTYSDGDWKIYVNCQLDNSRIASGLKIPQSTGGLAIGRKGDFAGDYFTGKIDEVRVYNRVLTAAEISQMYNCNNFVSVFTNNDTTICSNSPKVLSTSGTTDHFLWSTGDTSATITVSPLTTTTYWVRGQIGTTACYAYDTVTINTLPLPTIQTNNDTTVCVGTTLQLNTSGSSSRFLWSTGDTLASITVNITKDSTFWVRGQGGSVACFIADTIHIKAAPFPTISTLKDTAICTGGSILLTTTGNATRFLWSTGDTTSTLNITSTKDTVFWVRGQIGNMPCFTFDTVKIKVNQYYPFSIGNDTVLCDGSVFKLNGPAGMPRIWNTGDTSVSININVIADTLNYIPQKYWIVAGYSNCMSADTILIYALSKPRINMPLNGKTTICDGGSVSLSVQRIPPGAKTIWSNGDTSKSITVSPKVTTTYFVTYQNNLCGFKDSITITVLPKPVITISPDDTVCIGDPITLKVRGTNSYLWNTTATDSDLVVSPLVNTSYWVIGSNGTCTSDTQKVNIAVIPKPVALYTANPVKGAIPLSVQFTNQSTYATSYKWYFGDGDSTDVVSPKHIFVNKGIYSVLLVAYNSRGCNDTFSMEIIADEKYIIYIPNAFTPNGDLLNDSFEIYTEGVKSMDGEIFNRWGEVLYSWKMPNGKWWDGTYNDQLVPDGVYIYMISIKDNLNNRHVYKGTITVLH